MEIEPTHDVGAGDSWIDVDRLLEHAVDIAAGRFQFRTHLRQEQERARMVGVFPEDELEFSQRGAVIPRAVLLVSLLEMVLFNGSQSFRLARFISLRRVIVESRFLSVRNTQRTRGQYRRGKDHPAAAEFPPVESGRPRYKALHI